jgi:hypothetical protein
LAHHTPYNANQGFVSLRHKALIYSIFIFKPKVKQIACPQLFVSKAIHVPLVQFAAQPIRVRRDNSLLCAPGGAEA